MHDSEVPWSAEAARDLLTLPEGVEAKVFAYDPAMKRIDMKGNSRPAMSSRGTATGAGIRSL